MARFKRSSRRWLQRIGEFLIAAALEICALMLAHLLGGPIVFLGVVFLAIIFCFWLLATGGLRRERCLSCGNAAQRVARFKCAVCIDQARDPRARGLRPCVQCGYPVMFEIGNPCPECGLAVGMPRNSQEILCTRGADA